MVLNKKPGMELPRVKFDFEVAETCAEEVAFDLGLDPDVERIKAMPTVFEDWFDLETFKNSGVMAGGTSFVLVRPLRGRRPCAADRVGAKFLPQCRGRSPCGGGSAGPTPMNGSTNSGRRHGW